MSGPVRTVLLGLERTRKELAAVLVVGVAEYRWAVLMPSGASCAGTTTH
jgi:hypothetical protein